MIQRNRAKEDHEMLAKLLLKYGLATKEQVLSALAVARREETKGVEEPLGAVLLQMGIVTEKQLQCVCQIRSFLMTREQDKRSVEDLLKRGLCSPDQVTAAFHEQEIRFRKFRRICRLSEILAQQERVPSEQRAEMHPPANSSREASVHSETERDKGQANQRGYVAAVDCQPSHGQGSVLGANELTLFAGAESELRVSDDGLQAFLLLKSPHASGLTVEQVLALLESHGIAHGIVEESRIAEFLDQPETGERILEVARGQAPVEGRDGSIEYFFETDPLRIGAVKSGQRIDFKDRGEVPQVNEGEILARLIPTVEGQDGLNIYGLKTPVYKPKKLRLYCAEGVILSEDGLEARARRPGRPKISIDGRLVVEPEYVVQGDVNLATGHIDFDGSICVHGTVEDGFRVKGGSLSAKEIRKAQIEIAGDVVVKDGIIGATVKTQGNVKAKFIQGATIEAMGDVLVESSIIDSTVASCGTCFVRCGRIFSSMVQAKRGIEAKQIGSEQSRACRLVVGIAAQLEVQLAELKALIRASERKIARTENALRKLNGFRQRMEIKMGRLIQKQEDILRELRSLEEEAQELESVNNPAHVEQVKFSTIYFQSTFRDAERKMNDIQDKRCAPVKARMSDVKEKIVSLKDLHNELTQRFESLSTWAKESPPLPVVKVYGAVLAGTQIRTAHACTRLTKELQKVVIRESRETSKGGMDDWRITARPLRS